MLFEPIDFSTVIKTFHLDFFQEKCFPENFIEFFMGHLRNFHNFQSGKNNQRDDAFLLTKSKITKVMEKNWQNVAQCRTKVCKQKHLNLEWHWTGGVNKNSVEKWTFRIHSVVWRKKIVEHISFKLLRLKIGSWSCSNVFVPILIPASVFC